MNDSILKVSRDDGSKIAFMEANPDVRCVLTIDSEGRLIPGKDMAIDEVTQGVFAALAATIPKYAEIDRLQKENAKFRAALSKLLNKEFSDDFDVLDIARAALQPVT